MSRHDTPDVQRLLSQSRLSDNDLAALRHAGRDISETRLVDDFYVWLETQPEYAEFFADYERLHRVKRGQRAYWRQFLEASIDEQYVAARVHVGKVHARIKLGIQVYLASMNYCADWLKQALVDKGLPAEELHTLSVTLDRLVQLDSGIAIDAIAREHARIIEEQNRSLFELSTPTLKLWDDILLLPLVGVVDSQRASQIMEGLLHAIVDTGSRVAIVDVTGVPVIDTFVAQHLMQTMGAARMLGATVIFTGFSPHAAQTLTRLGVDLSNLYTAGSLRAGLRKAFAMTGHRINARGGDASGKYGGRGSLGDDDR